MSLGLVGRKVGMTRVFTDDGTSIPVTVIEVEPNRVSQIKTVETDGYVAVQVVTGSRRASRVTKPMAGHYKKAGVEAGRGAWEFRVMEVVPNEGDAAPKGPRIRHKMTDAKSIIIHTKNYEPPKPPKPTSDLTISLGDRKTLLDKAAMEAVARSPEPGQREARDTWALHALLGAAKLEASSGVRLVDQAGKTFELSSEELGDKSRVHIIKRNRRGLLNYRGWTLGPPASRVNDLRGVVSIELL